MAQGHVRSWEDSVKALWDRRVIILFGFGLSAGLPILLIFSTLSAWLTQADVSRSTITFFSWAALGYSFKWVWAPLIDRVPLPFLGRRRSWLLVAQAAIVIALVGMAMSDPTQGLFAMAAFAVMLGFASASQDIVIDAYRIEIAPPDLQGLLSAVYIAGYRVGMVIAGGLSLVMVRELRGDLDYSYEAWMTVYLGLAVIMVLCMVLTLVAPEPKLEEATDKARPVIDYLRFFLVFVLAVMAFALVFQGLSEWVETDHGALQTFLLETARFIVCVAAAIVTFYLGIILSVAPKSLVVDSYVAPLSDFLKRYGGLAILVLALIGTYRIADVVMGVVANIFYLDIGFEEDAIGWVSKTFGLFVSIFGSLFGGVLMVRYGVMPILFIGAALAAGTNILFAFLAMVGADLWLLVAVISADNFSGGIAASAFVGYLSALTSVRFTAIQYAIFSSLMLLIPKLLGGYSGMMSEAMGWEGFFIMTALLGLPVLGLVLLVGRLAPPRSS